MNEPLCRSCRHYSYTDVGHTEYYNNFKITRTSRYYCKELFVNVEREATKCNSYDDKRTPPLSKMEKMAFILEKKTLIGFDKPVYEFVKPQK